MKPENPTKTEGQRWGNLFRVAIVGAATLKGKELKEVLEEKNFPAMDIRLPAATVLGLLVLRAQKAGTIRNVVATIFEPVSEQGRRGMDELHEQTVNLLSFQPMPTEVFDSQVAFNLISRYGKASKRSLEAVEHRIGNDVRKFLGDRAPIPSLMLLQAPVFHAHTFSIYIELDKKISVGDFSQRSEERRVGKECRCW